MSLLESKRALSDAVLAVCTANSIPVVRENTQRPDGDGGARWARQSYRSNQPQAFTLGVGGDDKTSGFYQLDMMYPAGSGDDVADTDLELFRAALNRKTFTYGGQWVKVMSVGAPHRAIEDDTWFAVTFNFNWETLVQA